MSDAERCRAEIAAALEAVMHRCTPYDYVWLTDQQWELRRMEEQDE